MGSALLPQETHNKDTGCLSPDDFGDGGCSRFLHFAQRVLQETLPSPYPGQRPSSYRGTTHFHTLPSPPPGLLHHRHSATRACRPRVHGYGLFPRWCENLATTCPSFRLRCSVLRPTRHMARTRAPDKHAKILPKPLTLQHLGHTTGTGRTLSSA